MKKCIYCNSELVQADLELTHSYASLKPKAKGRLDFFRDNTDILTYVCHNCGHIEFFAENPDIFKNN